MTAPAPAPCPRTSTILVRRPLREDAAPPVAHGPCCYWDHLTAQWVPLDPVTVTARTS